MNQLNLNLHLDLEIVPGNYGVVLLTESGIEPVLVSVSENSAISFIEINSVSLDASESCYRYMSMFTLREELTKQKQEKIIEQNFQT